MTDATGSDIESVFSDAVEGGPTALSENLPMKRRSSVPELFRAMKEKEQRKSKKHKRDSKEDENEESSHVCRLAGESLETVKQIMVTEIGKVISLMERKFEAQEKRIEILEAELMQSDNDKRALHAKLTAHEKTICSLTEQMEAMDTNRRMNSLILKWQGFGKRSLNENVEEKVVNVLNQRFPDLHITASDLQTVHRLQGEYTVICKFLKTQLRNEVFERRMSQAGYVRGSGNSAAPLFINESLSPAKQALLNALLDAKRRKLVYTVYTKRGAVFCKRGVESRGQRVDSMEEVKSIVDGSGSAPAGSGGRSAPTGSGSEPGARLRGQPGGAPATHESQRQRGPGGPAPASRSGPAGEFPAPGAPPAGRDAPRPRLPGSAPETGRDLGSGEEPSAGPGAGAAGPGGSGEGTVQTPVAPGVSAAAAGGGARRGVSGDPSVGAGPAVVGGS